MPSDVPKEPMSWVIGAFAMSSENGLGVVVEPTRHQSTRPFYIQVSVPKLFQSVPYNPSCMFNL